MAKGINKVILVGNLGDDPETKYTQGGMAVTKCRVATTEKYKNREGDPVEKTEWHSVAFFGKLAEIAGEYLRKGSQVYVEGKVSYRQVDADDGSKKYYTDIVCHEMQMLGTAPGGSDRPRQSGGSAPQRNTSSNTRSAPTQQPRNVPGRERQHVEHPRRETAPASRDFGDDFADDDIPF